MWALSACACVLVSVAKRNVSALEVHCTQCRNHLNCFQIVIHLFINHFWLHFFLHIFISLWLIVLFKFNSDSLCSMDISVLVSPSLLWSFHRIIHLFIHSFTHSLNLLAFYYSKRHTGNARQIVSNAIIMSMTLMMTLTAMAIATGLVNQSEIASETESNPSSLPCNAR